MPHKVFSKQLHKLPSDLAGWEFGLDQAGTHLFGWNLGGDEDIELWRLNFLTYGEESFFLSHKDLLEGGVWLGPRSIQSLFGTLHMVQKAGSDFLIISSGDGNLLHKRLVPFSGAGSRLDRFTVDPRSRSATIWSTNPVIQYFQTGTTSGFFGFPRGRHECPWRGPLTEEKLKRSSGFSFFEIREAAFSDSQLIPAGGRKGVGFVSLEGPGFWAQARPCLGLTRMGGVIFSQASGGLLLAEYGKSGGLETTEVPVPADGILLVMQDAWSRLNVLRPGRTLLAGPLLEEWSLS